MERSQNAQCPALGAWRGRSGLSRQETQTAETSERGARSAGAAQTHPGPLGMARFPSFLPVQWDSVLLSDEGNAVYTGLETAGLFILNILSEVQVRTALILQ